MITGQTNGIVEDIKLRVKNKKIFWYPNSHDFENKIDSQIPYSNENIENLHRKNSFNLFYAGVLGIAQNLEVVMRAMHILSDKNVNLIIVGSGPEEYKLKKLKNQLNLDNVQFLGHKPRNFVLNLLPNIDVGIVPLTNAKIFRGAIPSKIFEILAHKKPILLGVDGEARRLFIDDGRAGVFIHLMMKKI